MIIDTKSIKTIIFKDDNIKYYFGMLIVGCMVTLQSVAWVFDKNGVVFAFTSMVIGATAGSILGFKFGTNKR